MYKSSCIDLQPQANSAVYCTVHINVESIIMCNTVESIIMCITVELIIIYITVELIIIFHIYNRTDQTTSHYIRTDCVIFHITVRLIIILLINFLL